MTNNNYIVFQCYGNEGVFHECAFALLSLSRIYPTLPASTSISIYTDNSSWFTSFNDCPLPITFRQVDQALIKQWRGTIDFVHRVKIEVLRDFCNNHDGNILYADTDIVFTHPIEHIWQQLSAGRLYMHVMEAVVNSECNPLIKKLNRYLHSQVAAKSQPLPLYDMQMWNAGVIGFNTSQKILLEEVLQFTDQEFPKFPKHIIEQFAFSVKFQQTGTIMAALPFIMHYWNLKEARTIFASFFSYFNGLPWQQLVALSGHIQLYDILSDKHRFEHNRSIMEVLSGKKWIPVLPDWKLLETQS